MNSRVVGLDVARGVALIGMLAVHVFPTFRSDGRPAADTVIAAGRAAATFALVAGTGIALLTGGRRVPRGRDRVAASAALAVRALMIAVVGLTLGYVTTAAGLEAYVILVYYAAMFLVAIPLLGLRARALAGIAGVVALLGPVVIWLVHLGPDPALGTDPRLGDVIGHPVGLLGQLVLSGSYPLVAWMAYICAGLAIGRCDLRSPRLGSWLLAGGLALALAAWWASSVLLFQFGGLEHLRAGLRSGHGWTDTQLVWDPPVAATSTAWWLVGRAPHSTAPLDVVHTLGSAAAVIGAALLVTRVALIRRTLRPVADAGSMVLTLYVGHLLMLSTGVLDNHPLAQFLVLLVAMIMFAVVWRRYVGRGPLESIVSWAADRARAAVSPQGTGHRLGNPGPGAEGPG